MTKIKKFIHFVQAIYEVETKDTYLDPTLYKSLSSEFKDIPLARKKYGKVFAEAPKSTGKEWGLTFEPTGEQWLGSEYRVIFSAEFFKNFIEQNKEANKTFWQKFMGIFGSKKYKNELDFNVLKHVNISVDRENFNRTHFSSGVPLEFRAIGLGYVIYEAFIKFLGYASSASDATADAKKVWSQIAADPDFLGIIIKKNSYRNFASNDLTTTKGNIFVIHKDCKIEKSQITQIIKKYLESKSENHDYEDIEIDEKIFEIYPEVKKAYESLEFQSLLIKLSKQTAAIIADYEKNNSTNYIDKLIESGIKNKIVIKPFSSNSKKLSKIISNFFTFPNSVEFLHELIHRLLDSKILSFFELLTIYRNLNKKDNALVDYLHKNLKDKSDLIVLIELVEDEELRRKILLN